MFVVIPILQGCFEDVVEMVDENIDALNQNHIGDAVGARNFVGFESFDHFQDLVPGEGLDLCERWRILKVIVRPGDCGEEKKKDAANASALALSVSAIAGQLLIEIFNDGMHAHEVSEGLSVVYFVQGILDLWIC